MLMTPLPNVNSIYSLLLQQERQLVGSDQSEDKIVANAVNANAGNNNSKEFTPNFNPSLRGGRKNNNRSNRGRNGASRGLTRSCSHRAKTGHTIETCYHKHGFPPHLQRRIGTASVNNLITNEDASAIKNSFDSNTSSQDTQSLDALFSQDQKKALIALFQQQGHDQSPSSLQTQAINIVIAPSAAHIARSRTATP
ncbi:hypothetical protein PIB30_119060 [Stylosanthes scabra]|uniref:Uncharacterized protein n=1 Tax=Stylosanthes scabra TaxID=79078 RepID=A0ABU6RNZ0_9FABA|nr:hypothetical protein [Stylosanthes scabra]